MPPTSTLPLSKARVEKDIMKSTVWSAAASLPLWPALEPQSVCVCVCEIHARVAERLLPHMEH